MARITQDMPQLPEGISWEDWNGNLIHYFGEEPIPYLPEDRWHEMAHAMASLTTFAAYGFPDSDTFDDWRDWARTVIGLVNGPTR